MEGSAVPLFEVKILGPGLVQETTNKIKVMRERIQTAKNCQKSYADKWRRNLEFDI